MSVTEQKRTLRAALLATRSALEPEQVALASRQVCALVAARPAFANARRVALYSALAGEIDLSPLAEQLRARGDRAFYPRIERRDPPLLAFHQVDDAKSLLLSPWGIPTPPQDAPCIALEELELFVVPGLGFDRRGGRLGFGKGFYDATLALAARAPRIGVCHPFQLLDQVPLRPEDEPMDLVVTPALFLVTAARPFVKL